MSEQEVKAQARTGETICVPDWDRGDAPDDVVSKTRMAIMGVKVTTSCGE